MIIACPQCDTKFVVPSTVFMRGGRKLRCASCKHSWFQEEPLERSENISPIAEPANAKPKKKDNNDSLLTKLKNDFRYGGKAMLAGFAIAIIGFGIYYTLKPTLIMGQGLAFDQIEIARDGNTMSVKGMIVNTMDAKRGVPSIEIIQILSNDIAGDRMIISPDKKILDSGEQLPISATINDVAIDTQNLRLSFKGVADTKPSAIESNDEKPMVIDDGQHDNGAHH